MLEAEAKARQGTRNDLTSVKFLTEVDRQVIKPARATEQAAQIVGTNRQYVSDAKRIKEQSPAINAMQALAGSSERRFKPLFWPCGYLCPCCPSIVQIRPVLTQ